MYGKIENNILMYAPNQIVQDGMRIINPTHDILIGLGYKPVTLAEYPQDGKHYKQGFEETDTEIIGKWIDNESEHWQNIPYEEAVNSKIRERYTESQEFAILRQKDEKPTEYAEYYAYCEECKNFVKEKKGLV